MAYPTNVPETANLRLAEKAFLTEADTLSKSYYNGQKWIQPSGLFGKWSFQVSMDSYLEKLHTFYPYQRQVKETYDNYWAYVFSINKF